jgi:hypothetical protein
MTDRKDYLALSLLALLVVCFAGEMVWDDKVPFFRDLGTYFYPMRFSLAESFKAGELPLWDRHVAMGYPLLADFQSGVFYPPAVLYLILPFFAAIRATFLFHYYIASAGTYLLFRAWRYPSFLAVIAGILFTLGGTMVSLTNLLNHFQTAVWLPWAILFAHKLLRERSWKNFLLLTTTLTVQFLAGSPEVYIMTQALVLLYGCGTAEGLIDVRNFFLMLAGADLIVAGLSMAQILPTLELFAESRARAPFSLSEAGAWSLRPVHLLNFLFIDKEIDIASYTSPKLFFSNKTPFMISYYMGALVPICVLFWLYYGSRKEKIVVSALVALSLPVAMGSYTPLYPLLFSYVPLFNIFRFPEKFIFLTYAALLFAALRGLRDFLQSELSWRRPFFLASLTVVLELLLYGYLRWDVKPLHQFIEWSIQSSVGAAWTLQRSSLVFLQLETELALVFGILLLLLLKKLGKLRQTLFAALLSTLVFIDLYAAHRSYQFLLSPEIIYRSPRVLEKPDPQPTRLFYYPGSSDVHPSYFTLPRELPLEPFLSLVFSNLLPNNGVFFGFDYMQELDALGRWPYLAFLGVARKLERPQLFHLLGTLNVRYINAFISLPETSIKLIRADSNRYSWLYKVDRVVPRAYVVSKAIKEMDAGKLLERLAGTAFNPLSEVILSEDAAFLSPNLDSRGDVTISRYENQAVDIVAVLNKPGILVLTDSFYPGWRAYVDGKEEKIYRANLFFRGVQLEAGAHRVAFRYEPWSFTLGLIVSLSTICGLALVTAILFIQKKKRHVLVNVHA